MSVTGSKDPDKRPSPNLRPPGKSDLPDATANRGILPLLLMSAMVALLIITGAVLFILPGILDSTSVQQAKPVVSTPVEAADKEAELSARDRQLRLDEARDAATAKLESLLTLKVQAEAGNIDVWAREAYNDVISLEKHGDQLFVEQDYVQAESYYYEALTGLSTLLDSTSRKFQEFLDNGYQLLVEEKSIEAQQSFSMALAINPENQDAQAGAMRAQNLDTVLALFQEALRHQQAGALTASITALEELLQLDSSYAPAQSLLAGVREQLEKQHFEQQMSSIYAHLENGDLKGARESLMIIKKTRESHTEIIQAEQMLVEKEERVRIAELRKLAKGFSSGEQWEKALTTYQQILTISPNILFAVNGRDQANKRLELDNALQGYLRHPHRLQDEKHLQAATNLLVYARQFAPGGEERLSGQVSQLANLVTNASTPVPVIIQSDNMTEVVMYHVGTLGSFEKKQIVLKPGRYTVVGSRAGYRDIRKIIEIDSQNKKNEFFVACRDPI